MADINEFTLQGIVPSFQNAVVSGNLDNEDKAFCHVKLNVQTSQKGEDGKYISRVHEASAFRKAAITLAKIAKPGTGLILRGSLGESREMVRNGQTVMTADGKKVYTGPQLIVSPYGIHFQRDYSKANGTTGGAATPAAPAVVDPLASFNEPAPAAPAKAANDGFSFGGSEDAGTNWPF